jgi:hypothetical protein
VPVLAWLLGRIGDVIESRKGSNGVSLSLQKARGWLRAHGAVPFARRGAEVERTR